MTAGKPRIKLKLTDPLNVTWCQQVCCQKKATNTAGDTVMYAVTVHHSSFTHCESKTGDVGDMHDEKRSLTILVTQDNRLISLEIEKCHASVDI